MTQNRLITLAAGGTAGHVFPAVALANTLEARGHKVALITDKRGGEIKGLGDIEVHRVSAGGVAGKSIVRRIAGVAELGMGVLQARSILKRMRPDAVVGFGGYASVPTMVAATMLNLPSAIHEQNAVLGRTNRLLAPRGRRIALSFEKSRSLPEGIGEKTIHTGMPVRPEIADVGVVPKQIADGSPLTILITGGSQGATVLSDVVPAAIAVLSSEDRARVRIIQQCRAEDIDRVRDLYGELGVDAELATFFGDMPERMSAADLMICRSGASSVAEALAAGRPTILVPYPYAVDDHQTANAHAVAEVGAGWLMDQSIFTPDRLAERIASLLENPRLIETTSNAARRVGRSDAALRLADMVEGLMGNGAGADRRSAA